MMDAAGKPYPLQVHLQSLELLSGAVALKMQIGRFQQMPDLQIILSVLVEKNIPSLQGSLREVINQYLLLQGQLLKARNAVPENLQIGKLLHYIVECIFSHHFGLNFKFYTTLFSMEFSEKKSPREEQAGWPSRSE